MINVKGKKMDKEKIKKYLWIAVLVLAVIMLSITYYFFLFRTSDITATFARITDILQPLIIGAVIAYIMKSTCNFFERIFLKLLLKSGKRDSFKAEKTANVLSVVAAYIVWFIAIALLLWIAIPQIIDSVISFITNIQIELPRYVDYIIKWEQSFLADNDTLRPIFDKVVETIVNWANTDLTALIQNYAVKTLIPAVFGIIGSLVDIAIGIVISVFILLGRKKLAAKSVMLLHCIFKKDKTVNTIVEEFKFADRMFSGFLEGKVIDSTIIGILYYIVLSIMKVPYAPLVAVICGVTNIIPIFGPFIGAIPSGFIILTANPAKVIPFVIFVVIIQFVDGYIIDPHIVGGNIKLSSFCVVFAVIFFGGLWGFMGLLVGVPTFAVIYDIAKRIACHILKKRGKGDLLNNFYNTHKKGKSKHRAASTAEATAGDPDMTEDTQETKETVTVSSSADNNDQQ